MQRGAPGAFRARFDRVAPRVWRFLRDLLGEAAADEATQETFVGAAPRA